MNGKIIAVDWQTVQSALDGDDICIRLKQGHVIALASILEFFRWRTRWKNLDSSADILAFTDDLEHRIMGCGCFDCNDVVTCIEDNIDEITELITKNQTFIEVLNQQINEAIENYNVVINPPAGGDCTARIWSASRAIVRRLHNDTVDFLEQLEVYTNFNEFLAVVAFLPLLDESGIDTLFQLFNYIQENVLEQYNAFYTDEIEDEISCAIFCSIKCNEFTLDAVIRAYEQRAMKNVSSLLSIQTYLNVLVAGGLPTNALMIDVLHLLALGLAKLGATKILNIFQIDPRAWVRYVNVIRVGLRDEDDSYNEFCDCPPETWTHVFNFEASNGGFTVMTDAPPAYGLWQSGIGWIGQYGAFAGDFTTRVRAERTFTSATITAVRVEFDMRRGNSTNSPNWAIRLGTTVILQGTVTNTSSVVRVDETWNGSATVNRLDFRLIPYLGAGASGAARGEVTMKKITVTGTGINPFI